VTSAGSNYTQATAQEEPAPLPEHLSLPIWIAQALDAPEASVRIHALDIWAQQGVQASLDPLVVALDDENDDVRTKAMEIIEQHWAIDQKAEAEK
jgi:HEAT repeat protein